MMTAGGAHGHGFTRRAGDIPNHLYAREGEAVAYADSLLARVQDLIWKTAPEGEAATIEALTELQSAVHELDQCIVHTGDLPMRWRRKVDTPPSIA